MKIIIMALLIAIGLPFLAPEFAVAADQQEREKCRTDICRKYFL
jgi:hypothetical protein